MPQLLEPYKYSKGYIIHRLNEIKLPATINLSGVEFIAKDPLHCSLIAVKKIVPIIMERDQTTEANTEEKVLEAVSTAIMKIQPHITGYLNEFRIAEKPDEAKRTVIVMAKVDGIEQLFIKVNEILNLEIPTQPTHVTLYTLANGKPIGVTSINELADFTRPLTPAELITLRDQLDVQTIFGITP